MRVLITNDDGIGSPGLAALVHAFEPIAETYVVAPEHERSATGHAITLHKPLRAHPASIPGSSVKAWSTNGTPADCVALGILDLLAARPDVVISGINVGPNLGRDLTYSGTVSGAMEGAIFRVPSIALSIGSFRNPVFSAAAAFAVRLADAILQHGLPEDTLLNVNVPNLPPEEIKGIEITRLGRQSYSNLVNEGHDGKQTYYWIVRRAPDWDLEAGTDIWAVRQGCISISPLHTDWTSPNNHSLLRGLIPALTEAIQP